MLLSASRVIASSSATVSIRSVAMRSSGSRTSTLTVTAPLRWSSVASCSSPVADVACLEEDRAQAEDEVADVADHRVERIDRLIDPPPCLLRLVGEQVRDVLQRERLGVDRLDDAVVEVAADPIPLVDDGEAAYLVVQPRVVDRDPRVQREHLDQRLVIGAELGRTELVRQVEPTHDFARAVIGIPRKLCIGGWFAGNP